MREEERCAAQHAPPFGKKREAKAMGKEPFFGAAVAIKPEFHQHQEGRKQQQGGIEAQPSHDKWDELQQRVVRGEGAIEVKNVNLFFHIFFNLLGLSFVKGAPMWHVPPRFALKKWPSGVVLRAR